VPDKADALLNETIELLFPAFMNWCKETKGYRAPDGVNLIQLWYEFLDAISSKGESK